MAQFGPCPSASGCGSNVVMFGGLNLGPTSPGGFLSFDQFNVLGDTWIWDGTDWTELAGPQPRYDPLSAHLLEDPATGVLVLTAQPGRSWTWNGALWMDQHPAAMPAVHTALVSDGSSLTLLGGPTLVAGLGERWTWVHGSWHITTRVTRSEGPLHS